MSAWRIPRCPELSQRLYRGAKDLGFSAHAGGTYVCIEGPQFSTRAESEVYRSLGFSVIGMTNIPEAQALARSRDLLRGGGVVTDYDVWKTDEEVSVEKVVAI